jgi:hypothetical protein
VYFDAKNQADVHSEGHMGHPEGLGTVLAGVLRLPVAVQHPKLDLVAEHCVSLRIMGFREYYSQDDHDHALERAQVVFVGIAQPCQLARDVGARCT